MFNYMNVGFVQNRTYDEKIHAKELGYGMRNCVMTATDFEFDAVNHRVGWGRAIMGGTPVRLGSTGEYFDLPINYSGPVTLKRVLNGNASTVEMITTEPAGNTDTTYYFKLYDIALGAVTQDYRSIEWVHSFYLKNMGGSNIAWVLNGFTSQTFDASVLAGNRTLLSDVDIVYDDAIHGASLLQDQIKDIIDKGQLHVGNDKPFEVSFRCTVGSHPNLDADIDAFILSETGKVITNLAYVFRVVVSTNLGVSGETTDVTNNCYIELIDGTTFQFLFDYDNFANVKVVNLSLKQEWSLDELGLDGTWVLGDVPGNIKKAYDKVVSLIGNKTTFTITQVLYRNSTSGHYEFSQSIEDDIVADYGQGLGTTGFEFSITFGLVNGVTLIDSNLGNFINITANNNRKFTKMFNFVGWDDEFWTDEKGAPHADLAAEISGYMDVSYARVIDVPLRDYISGITFWLADFDTTTGNWTNVDGRLHYVPRVRTVQTFPDNAGDADDTLFSSGLSFLGSLSSSTNPITSLTQIANMYFAVNYADTSHAYPNGITVEGLLGSSNDDQVLAGMIIHYGSKKWSAGSNDLLQFVQTASYTPTLLREPTIETPNIEPEIDNGVRGDK